MLNAVDNGIGNVTKALQAADMWDDTLIVREPQASSLPSRSKHPTEADRARCLAAADSDLGQRWVVRLCQRAEASGLQGLPSCGGRAGATAGLLDRAGQRAPLLPLSLTVAII